MKRKITFYLTKETKDFLLLQKNKSIVFNTLLSDITSIDLLYFKQFITSTTFGGKPTAFAGKSESLTVELDEEVYDKLADFYIIEACMIYRD